jgi:hypothetical protein
MNGHLPDDSIWTGRLYARGVATPVRREGFNR